MRQIFRTTRQRQTDLSRDGGIVLRMNAARISRDARLARIRIFANRHRQRQLTKQRHMVVFAHRLRTTCADGTSHTPASDAIRKWRSRVSCQRAGRRPLRSSVQAA